MAATDDPVVITPVAAPLSSAGSAPRGRRRKRWSASWRALAFAAVLVLLGGAGAFVFLVLPDRVEAPSAKLSPVPDAATAGARGAATDGAPAPYRSLEIDRARQRAQAELDDFVAAQLVLEQELNVGAWGEAELARIKDRAGGGDRLFMEAEYDAAMAEYAAATADLQALVADGRARFDAAIAEGAEALAARDQPRAVAAFARALAIRPGHPRGLAGAERADRLAEVIRLLRESERALLRGDLEAAGGHLAAVRALDPATAGLQDRFAAVDRARANARRKAVLSDGFAALHRGDHDAAHDVFDAALRDFPDDASAQAGLQQAKQARTLAAIDRLRGEAEAALAAEHWAVALARYEDALDIDPTLQFARRGKDSVGQRVALVRVMERVLADPGLLSSDAEFAAASEALERAGEHGDAGAKFGDRVARFRAVVERGAVPVPLVLVSDNATEVAIVRVGAVGVFERKELALRPGRYVIVGSRDGCRDVRKEIVLAPDMAPVDIRCAESI